MKIKANIDLIKVNNSGVISQDWRLIICDEMHIVENCYERFIHSDKADRVNLQCEIKSIFQTKTTPQMAYLHAEILPKFYKFMSDSGDDRPDDVKRSELKLHPDIGFYTVEQSTFTGKDFKIEKSFAYASKDEVRETIDKFIRLAADFGISIQTPEEYYNKIGYNTEKIEK